MGLYFTMFDYSYSGFWVGVKCVDWVGVELSVVYTVIKGYLCSDTHIHRQTNPFKFSIQSHTVYVNTDYTDPTHSSVFGLSMCAFDFVMVMHILIDSILLSVYFQNMKIRN